MLDLSQNNGHMFSYADDIVAIFSGLTWNNNNTKETLLVPV